MSPRLVSEMLGDLVAVEFVRAVAAPRGGAHAYRGFKRDELTRFSTHRRTIRRYMRIVKETDNLELDLIISVAEISV
jgi:hypothetical protein